MSDAIESDRIPKRLDNVILSDDIFEPLGPIAASDNGITARITGYRGGGSPWAPGHEARSVGLEERLPIVRKGLGRAGEVLPGT